MNEARFQYSASNGNGGILVARTDDQDEMELLKMWVDDVMGQKPTAKPVQTTVASQTPTVAAHQPLWCNKHQIAMKLNKNGKPYHMDRSRPEGNMFCNGRGFKDEFEGQSSEEIGKKLNAEDYSL